MFHLPTYEECQSICQNTNNDIFYETQIVIDGFKVSFFNYRLATYSDFLKYDAFELRGLTFVFNYDGSLYKRFLLLEKFFNVGEVESTQIQNLIDKKITSVEEKFDGSIISFIKLPNGSIKARSKMSFDSDQAKLAQNIFENNPELHKSISDYLDSDVVPIFELISPLNQIVVRYNVSDLVLLKLRDNTNGNYLSIKNYNLKKTENFDLSLKEMLEQKSTIKDFEGWVIEFNDGQKVKLKTDWYMSLHRLMTETSVREDYIIEFLLDNKIDDLLSLHPIGSEIRIFIEEVVEKTLNKVKKINQEVNQLLSLYDGDRKKFAMMNHKKELFNISINIISGLDRHDLIVEHIKKLTYRLESARTWLSE